MKSSICCILLLASSDLLRFFLLTPTFQGCWGHIHLLSMICVPLLPAELSKWLVLNDVQQHYLDISRYMASLIKIFSIFSMVSFMKALDPKTWHTQKGVKHECWPFLWPALSPKLLIWNDFPRQYASGQVRFERFGFFKAIKKFT